MKHCVLLLLLLDVAAMLFFAMRLVSGFRTGKKEGTQRTA